MVYQRNTAGSILIDPATGLPLVDPNFKVRGDRNPNFTLGWINNITYKDLRVSFLWDLRVGGDIFNATEMYMTLIGRSQRSVDRMTPRVVAGVLKDGLENSANLYFKQYCGSSLLSTNLLHIYAGRRVHPKKCECV